MTILSTFGGTSGVDTGDIPYSLRFRGAQWLSRTPSVTGNRQKWIALLPAKRSKLGAIQYLISAVGSSRVTRIGFDASDRLVIYSATSAGGGDGGEYISNRVFRDPTSWQFIVVAYDSTQATAGDRIKVWVNQEQITSWATSTAPTLNHETQFNWTGATMEIGRYATTNYFEGYGARISVVDGGSGDNTTFGYLNTEINEWVSKSQAAVKAVVDAGGTNSFMLDFDDGTSLTTLGYDKSSKGNNWTLNNFSLTAGTTYDHMLDVPGNSFATLNPIYPSAANITNGNLTSGTTAVRATMNALAYNSKWEVTAGGSAVTAGVISGTGTTNTTSVTANKIFAFRLTTAGALDYRNVTDSGAWTSITTGLTGEQYPYGVTQAANWNFGQAPLHASATYQSAEGGYFFDTTAGFKALCQRNMPDPAILNPELHFDVRTRTGTAATYSVSDLLFQPDFLWAKSRGRAVDHALYDSVRGVQKQLESNSAGAETTESTGLTSFNANGYTGGALDQINGTTATNSFVDWLWKAGGAAVTNNAGSISSQVSANVEAGFSIVTYTSPNNAADQTVGHGLTKAPGLIIAKNRISGVLNWDIYHSALASGYGLSFTTTASTAGRWPTTAPTSSVFSTKNTYEHNGTDTYVAYCFAEIAGFSKIFSYTGNGSADGPYVDCGFKPKYVLVKCSGSTGTWRIYDAARPGYNVIGGTLQAESSAAESTAAEVDFTANGFKLRVATDPNTATTYIGIAFADVAGKYSLGR